MGVRCGVRSAARPARSSSSSSSSGLAFAVEERAAVTRRRRPRIEGQVCRVAAQEYWDAMYGQQHMNRRRCRPRRRARPHISFLTTSNSRSRTSIVFMWSQWRSRRSTCVRSARVDAGASTRRATPAEDAGAVFCTLKVGWHVFADRRRLAGKSRPLLCSSRRHSIANEPAAKSSRTRVDGWALFVKFKGRRYRAAPHLDHGRRRGPSRPICRPRWESTTGFPSEKGATPTRCVGRWRGHSTLRFVKCVCVGAPNCTALCEYKSRVQFYMHYNH